jgi:peptidyl-prolyl cis-trans isomerase D
MVMTTAPITAQGADETGQPVPGLTPDVLKTAFALSSGGESELIEIGKGEYYAVKVEKVIPAALPPLAEIKPQLTAVWLQNEMGKRLKAKADALVARVKKGESLDAVAASAGAKVQRVAGISRQNAQQHQGLGRELLMATFGAKPGDVFTSRARPGGLSWSPSSKPCIRATSPRWPRSPQALRPQIDQGLMRDLGETVRQAAKTS